MTDLTTERPTGGREPRLEHDPADRYEPQPVDSPSFFADGVELSCLIARTQLTLAQALEISVNVSAEAVRRGEAQGGSLAANRAVIGPIAVGADGRVVRGRPADGSRGGTSSAAGPAVESVLAGIADAIRLRARGAGPAAEQLLAELDRAVAELPVVGVPAVARRLRELAATTDRSAVRAQLGALVRAVGAGVPSGTRPDAVWSAPVGTATAGRTSGGPARTARRRRMGPWLLSVLVLGGVVLLEVVLLRHHIAVDIGLLLKAGRSGSTPSVAASQNRGDQQIAAPAPASAGSVTAVDLRALAPCAPNSSCTVRLEVLLAPRAEQQPVSWSYRIIDPCTGAADTAPGGSVTLPTGATGAVVVGTVPLPASHAVVLTAVTGKPAVAASAPLLVGSCPSRP